MNQTTIEYVLGAMYIALMSAGNMTAHERALANDTLYRCAELDCAPALAPQILRRIANNAVTQDARFPEPPSRSRRKFGVITGGVA